jgi:hypothetical protein
LLRCIVNTINKFTGSGNLQVFQNAFKNSFVDTQRIPVPRSIDLATALNANRFTRHIGSFLEGQNDTITADALELYTKLRVRIPDMSEQDIDRLVLDVVRDYLRNHGRGRRLRTRRKNNRKKIKKIRKFI